MAQLPPKAPGMPQNWPSFSYQMMQMPSSVAQPPSWVDEFLDFSSSRRNSHRRSVSDPIAFIEAPNNFIDIEECRNVVNIDINAASSAATTTTTTTTSTTHIGFDRLDDEQLRSMFADDDVAAAAVNLALSSTNSSNPSSPTSTDDQLNSDIDNPADQIKPVSTNHHAAEQAHVQVQIKQQPKNEPEEDGGGRSPADSTDPDKFSFQANSADIIVDPKRVKRILANRQSAQRSRVRKLQYISELERSVTTLQTEVSALSPRVAFLDHQRLILNVDNSALKQRIAALAQDKIFKDAHQEALRKEIERLRKLYQEQNHLKNMAGGTVVDRATSSPPPPERQEQPTPASFNNNNITSTTAAAEDQ